MENWRYRGIVSGQLDIERKLFINSAEYHEATTARKISYLKKNTIQNVSDETKCKKETVRRT
jgi:hypothetical protein